MSNITYSHDDDLEELLDSGRYRKYLQAISYFHDYSCRNILLISRQMPHATKIASYDVWKKQYNRTIIRDSKSIKILSPVLEKPKFKEISVFDVSQTSGSPIPKLVDNFMDDEALYGAFFDSLKAVAPTPVEDINQNNEDKAKVLSSLIIEMVNTKNLCGSGQNLTFPQLGERLAQDSIAYVICQRFGIDTANSFDYIADEAGRILPYFGELLDIIRTEASNLINALEDNFKLVCEKQGINPVMDYEPKTKPIKPAILPPKGHVHKEPPHEPLYNVVPRIEKTAIGVDFTHYDVFPVKPALKPAIDEKHEPQPVPPQQKSPQLPQRQALQSPRRHIPPDSHVSIADRDNYGYTRCQELLPIAKERAIQLFKRDMTVYMLYPDNWEAMVLDLTEIEAHSGFFAVPHMEWYNSMEYSALASGNPEAQQEATFIYDSENAFAVYQLKDGLEDGHTEPYRFVPYSQLAQMGLFVDYYNYSIVYTGTLLPSDNPERLFMRFNMSKPQGYSGRSMGISDVLSIQSDGEITSYFVDDGKYTQLISFLGIESQSTKRRTEDENVKQEPATGADCQENPGSNAPAQQSGGEATEGQIQEHSPQSVPSMEMLQPSTAPEMPTVDTTPEQPEAEALSELPLLDDSANEGDAVLAEIMSKAQDFSDIDVYPHSLKEAEEHGYAEVYKFNLMINVQCATDIDNAIEASKIGNKGEYRLTEAVNKVVGKYGRNRIAWVLSMAIKNTEGGGFSKENEAWAVETLETFGYPKEPTTFLIKTFPVLLDVFISRFRELQTQKLGYKERMEKAAKRVKAQAQQTPQ